MKKPLHQNRPKGLIHCALALSLLLLAGGCGKNGDTMPDIRIGVLIDLTGTASSVGVNSAAALELAQSDILDWLGSMDIQSTLELVVEDVRSDTAYTLERMKALYDDGIRIFIGPYSSTELAAVKGFADSHDVLFIGPASVASSLSVAGDNIFRLIPDDRVQSQATAALMIDEGVKFLVPFIRDDAWGRGILHSTTEGLTAGGGAVAAPHTFDATGNDFSGQLSLLDGAVGEALRSHSAAETAVYLLSFAEGTAILNAAPGYPNLNKVKWYGSSAYGLNPGLPANHEAAAFAAGSSLPCTMYGPDESARHLWEPLQSRLAAVLGHQPDSYALTSYDALWLLVRTLRSAGSDQDFARLKTIFTDEAQHFFGVSGNTILNEAGDRAFGNYDFWGVRSAPGGFAWQRLAWYNSATGTLIRLLP